MLTLILSFMAGLGLTLFLLFMIFATIISCAGLIAIIRAAINPRLGNFAKIVWIIACFFPGIGLLYFAFVDQNRLLKFTGWACILFFAIIAVTGGAAMQGAVKSFEHSYDAPNSGVSHEWKYEQTFPKPEKPREKRENGNPRDDTGLSL